MNQNIIIIIPFVCGGMLGIILGIIISGMTQARRMVDLEKQTWAAARRFYARQQMDDIQRRI